ncbi:hypothetical protein [Parvularcula sp. LCG005]|uniref:hypothetical protein n=1 Tax=Parvularcula sp. LCG005 TaxID=3078805 RepID=UPI002942EDFF|nr:hypothetical protein [Parvularcula sp. LCG005]WOI53024.1 hypothetical protein RUI03_12795 [Parvularcula sp. LCG005]
MVQTEIQTPFGEIYSSTNNSGGYVARNKYDVYGDPSSTNSTRFQYTGQIYLKAAGLYHYNARAYHPFAVASNRWRLGSPAGSCRRTPSAMAMG